MKFAYSTHVSSSHGTSDYVLFRRPEIPVTITGPGGSATYLALVDTGSDSTIFPKSVADYLRIAVAGRERRAASAFAGAPIELHAGEASFHLEADGETISWKATISFYEFTSPQEEVVLLGHAGFLDYFTATFDGKDAILTLEPNDELPRIV